MGDRNQGGDYAGGADKDQAEGSASGATNEAGGAGEAGQDQAAESGSTSSDSTGAGNEPAKDPGAGGDVEE